GFAGMIAQASVYPLDTLKFRLQCETVKDGLQDGGSYKSYYARKNNVHEDDVKPGNIATGIIGATSGAFGASVVYPLNVVRTTTSNQGTAMHPATYTGIWDVTKKTINEKGIEAYTRALHPTF
ncbi:hypothetical protein ACKAV7_012651, partial [Fusarium commune]